MRKLLSILWLIIPLSFAAASTGLPFLYPDLIAEHQFRNGSFSTYDASELSLFIGQWVRSDDVQSVLPEDNNTISRLESVLRIQTIQLEQLRRQKRPVFSLSADPSNPLYGFSMVSAPSFDFTLPGMVDKQTLTHRFGLALGISQLLPTAGSVDLTTRYGASVASLDGGAWTWKQQPSVSLSLRQPLALGDSFLDTSYGNKKEERQLLVQYGAAEAVRHTSEQLSFQALQLRGTLQALLESRWLATNQAAIADDALDDAREDLLLGLISRNQLTAQEQALAQQLLQIDALDREIVSIRHALENLLEQEVDLTTVSSSLVSLDSVRMLEGYRDGALLAQEELIQQALASDAEYRKAERELRIAQLDRALGNPADAPTFSLSMQLSPYYTPTAGNELWGSFDEMWTSSDPNFSVTVGFQFSDLSRNLGKSTRKLTEEQMVQSSLAKESAESQVLQKARDLQLRIDQGFLTLGLRLSEYRQAVNAIEIEKILAESYQGNALSMRRRELAMYGSAFALLQHLRLMHLLSQEVQLFVDASDS